VYHVYIFIITEGKQQLRQQHKFETQPTT